MSVQKMQCKIGKFDIPIIQLQPDFEVDILDSNIMIFGSAMSGKTTFIKSFISILHKRYSEKEEQIFVLDFGGALAECKGLPLVSAYFDNSNEEYVKRVFKIMDGLLKDNIKTLNGRNFRDSEIQPIHTTLIVDNLNAFVDEPRFISYNEKFLKLCREGLSKGITIVATAADTKGIFPYLANFKQKVVFEMPPDKYADIFNEKVKQIGNNPGHGFANVTVKPKGVTGTFRMNVPYEVQCVYPYDEKQGEKDFFENLKHKFGYENGEYVNHVKKYLTFPEELTKSNFEELTQNRESEYEPGVCVGLDYVNFEPVYADIDKSRVIAIYGKKEFGKTNLLNLMVDGIIKKRPDVRFVLWDDGRDQLHEIYERIKADSDVIMINQYEERTLLLKDESETVRKLSPLDQFYLCLNDNYINLDKRFMAGIYGVSKELSRDFLRIPDCRYEVPKPTVFIIQSKMAYLNSNANRYFINAILPQMVAVAEEYGFYFIFSDVQKISDGEQNMFFNNMITSSYLLDNIAEFASERGQKTIYGNMDTKTLKEDYARCELGDGYFYDVEADVLKKMKFIKY